LDSFLPSRVVDRMIMTVTCLGFAVLLIWFRWKLAGSGGIELFVPLSLLIAASRLWLLGLYPFLLGACLVPVTLVLWWKWKDDLALVRALVLAGLLLVGYFFHIISAGVTVIALAALSIATPGKRLWKRLLWTGFSILPVVALILHFQLAMRSAGGPGSTWNAIGSWWSYVQMPDFISISFKKRAIGFLDLPY